MVTLAPVLLWTSAVVLFEARRLPSRALFVSGFLLALVGTTLTLLVSSGIGAGFGAALAHLTAALSLVAICAPLTRSPRLVSVGVVLLGVLVGVLERSL